MAEIREPSTKEQTETSGFTQKMEDFLNEVRNRVLQFDIDGSLIWLEKMRIARNMRQGIKRVTNFPYPGAPDIPLPEVDKLIRKQKAKMVLAAVSGKNYMSIKPLEGVQNVDDAMKQKAEKAEMAMNNLFTSPKMDWKMKLTLQADGTLEKGFCIFKIIEKFESNLVNRVLDVERDFTKEQVDQFRQANRQEKEAEIIRRFGLDPEIETDKQTIKKVLKDFGKGTKIIRFTTEEVTSLPDVIIPPSEKIYVPKDTTEIQKAARITHEFFLSEHDLRLRALQGVYDKAKVDKILEDKSALRRDDDTLNEKTKDRLEGVAEGQDSGEMFKMHEIMVWWQKSKDKPAERWVFTLFADVGSVKKTGETKDSGDAVVAFKPYPFEAEGWNYVKHNNEIMDQRYRSSRGIPEQIRSIVEFLERSMNNMLIRDEVNNAPMWTVLSTSSLKSNNVRFLPGSKFEVGSHDEIRKMDNINNVDVSSERINQLLKAYAEEYLGVSDQLFRNATNEGGGKTLGEIKLGVSRDQFISGLEIMLWLDSLRKVYEKVFQVFKERLTGSIFINNVEITREDFDFVPNILPNGSEEMADKQLQAQKSVTRLNLSRQAVEDGVATPDDVFNAYQEFFEKDGVTNPDNFTTDPKVILQEQITQLQQQAQQLNQMIAQQNQVLQQGDQALEGVENKLREGQGGENGRPGPTVSP